MTTKPTPLSVAKDGTKAPEPIRSSGAISTQIDDAIIDLEMLSELEDAIDIEGAVEVIETCLEELNELCTDYSKFESSHNETEKRRLAHKIKGCAASACAKALTSIAASIEDADTKALQQYMFGPELIATLKKTTNAFYQKYDI